MKWRLLTQAPLSVLVVYVKFHDDSKFSFVDGW